MKKPLISFYMQAYNTENYIEQAIESVLNQTLENIEFILLNNGSTDNTGEICKKYAEKDKRVVYLENEKNTVLYQEYKGVSINPKGEYYSTIDSDDYLELNYAEEMYKMAKKNNADLVIGGTCMFMNSDKSKTEIRVPPQINTRYKQILPEEFPKLYGLIRQSWGKLYRTDFYFNDIKSFILDFPDDVMCAKDTFEILRYVQKSKVIVSIDKVLHNYRVHEKSIYYTYLSPTRVKESKYIYDEGVNLLKKLGVESQELIGFLQEVHFCSMKDNMKNAMENESAPLSERLELVQTILKDDLFCSYALKNNNIEAVFETVGLCVDSIIKGKSLLDISSSGNYFVARLYQTLANQDTMEMIDLIPSLLSIICDSNNNNSFGIHLLDTIKVLVSPLFAKIITEIPECIPLIMKEQVFIRSIINADYDIALRKIDTFDMKVELKEALCLMINEFHYSNNNERIEKIKYDLANSVEEGDLESAIPLLLKLLGERPLDLEGLYFKIYISWQLKEVELAVNTLEVAMVFWNDDEDMMQLCKDIFVAIKAESRLGNIN